MSKTFLILSLFTQYSFTISSLRGACAPNTQFILNGLVCLCDKSGQWSEENCRLNLNIDRRALCTPGTILWQGCSYCICKEDGHLSCRDNACSNVPDVNVHRSLSKVIDWCTPFRYYYVDCHVCICPASGRAIEARCSRDRSCKIKSQPLASDPSAKKNECMPKVMYLFPCLHCLCSDEGVFTKEKCVDTCTGRHSTSSSRKCVPGRLYRTDCNICKCPATGFHDPRSCTKVSCDKVNVKYLKSLRNQGLKCTPYTFTSSRCLYCDCTSGGTVDENACYELECPKSDEYVHDPARTKCSPGEIVKLCVECLCLRYGQTTEEYCTRSCSYKSKLDLLERIVKDSQKNDHLIDKNVIKKNPASDICQPNTVYKDNRKYCVCPDIATTNFNLCTSSAENVPKLKAKTATNADVNSKCEPYTYVDFGCNSCFCSKNGTIDPKWCTYDNCEAKKMIQDSHVDYTPPPQTKDLISQQCTPGSMSKVQCNFCICPSSGRTKDSACTKNICAEAESVSNRNLICEPLAYFEVDCNVCYCPHNGIKNVAKCTKNHCEKSFLRSDTCEPGQLFTDECNVCICPPNGNKEGKACTNYTCSDTAPWQKITQISKSLIGELHQVEEDATRNLDLCFPGEEFTIGCKLCVCPDMGLKDYATCSPISCKNEEFLDKTRQDSQGIPDGQGILASQHATSNQGSQGTPGSPGALGSQGTQEIQSNAGSNGTLGSQGALRSQGTQEIKGNPDTNDTLGSQGTQEIQGNPGSNGTPVSQGDLGSQGTQEIQGNPGINVTPGSQGALRSQGTQETQGLPGTNDTLGSQSTQEIQGNPGSNGTLGSQGALDSQGTQEIQGNPGSKGTPDSNDNRDSVRSKRTIRSVLNKPIRRAENCKTITFEPWKQECTPGSMYIVRCKQCICPYMGHIHQFCREMPKDFYCEQAFPGVNYMSMGRRTAKKNSTNSSSTLEPGSSANNVTSPSDQPFNETLANSTIQFQDWNVSVIHEHTIYSCQKIGKVMDECFICECEEPGNLIEEHCFRSDSEKCADAKPSFLGI